MQAGSHMVDPSRSTNRPSSFNTFCPCKCIFQLAQQNGSLGDFACTLAISHGAYCFNFRRLGRQTQLTSFQRQLGLYGFSRISSGKLLFTWVETMSIVAKETDNIRRDIACGQVLRREATITNCFCAVKAFSPPE